MMNLIDGIGLLCRNHKRNRVSKDAYQGYQLVQAALKEDDFDKINFIESVDDKFIY